MDKRTLKLISPSVRKLAKDAIDAAPDGWFCRISEPTRTLDQNAKMWAVLADIAEQVVWHGHTLTAEEWKDVLTAALKSQKVVPGLEGNFVVIGASTSRMKVEEMAGLITLAECFGAEQGVEWTQKEQRR